MLDEPSPVRAKIGEGREAEIFAWEASAVLRLMRDQDSSARLAREAVVLRTAHAAGAPVPWAGDLVTVDGRPGLVMERVDGADLFTVIARRPWKLFRAARITGEIHAKLHRLEAPDGLTETRAFLAERISRASSLSAQASSFALRTLDGLPDGNRLCHGDFHPGNVLVGERGPVVIDWTNCSRGDADSDVGRTLLMLEMAVIPDTVPAVVRRMAPASRRSFVAAYVHAYRRSRLFDRGSVERWRIVHAAARCAEGIDEETPLLARYVERHAGGHTE